MTYIELLPINPSSLDGYSVYDYNIHLPLPTFSFILQETGVDLVLATGSEQEAQSVVRFLSQTAMNIIKDNVPPQAKINIEFLIAKSAKHRQAFITMVAYLVLTTRAKGLDDLLANTEQIAHMVKIQAHDLLQHKYDFVVDEVRGDY
jgi:hypothetical protein